MLINTDTMVSITEANQNFSKVSKLVDEKGSVTIMKNNCPRYVLIDYNQLESEQSTNSENPETLEAIAHRLINRRRKVYEELAK